MASCGMELQSGGDLEFVGLHNRRSGIVSALISAFFRFRVA